MYIRLAARRGAGSGGRGACNPERIPMTVFPRWLLFVVAIAGLPVLASAQYHAGAVPYESDILDARPVRYFVAGAVGGLATQQIQVSKFTVIWTMWHLMIR